MRMKWGIWASAIVSAGLLAGCGGSDIFTGSVVGPDGDREPELGNIRLLLSQPELNSGVDSVADPNNPAEAVIITAIITDKSSVVVPDQEVLFSLPTGNGTLQIINSITDETGAARAFLTNGGNVLNRIITVRADAGELGRTVDVAVTGTNIALSGPASLGLGSRATFRARLTNGRGVDSPTAGGIEGQALTITSNPGAGLRILNGTDGVTDASGVLEFDVEGITSTPDGVPELLSVSALGEEAVVPVTVSQFSIALSGAAELQEINLGDSVNLTVTLRDSSGPAVGQQLDLGATRGLVQPSSGTTDANGQLTATYTAAGGVGRALVRVFGPNGSIGDRLFQLTTDTPYRVDLQADPGSVRVNNSTQFTATVRDVQGNLVQGEKVEFDLVDTTGGSLSTPNAFTDAQGRASVTYTASSSPSGNRGVIVRAYTEGAYNPLGGTACNDTDGDGTDNENSDSNGGGSDSNLLCDQFALTVGGLALRVALGTGNTIAEPNATTYLMPWSALVTDSAGNPAPPGTTLRLKVTPYSYQKGYTDYFLPTWERVYTVLDFDESPPPTSSSGENFFFDCPSPDVRCSYGDGCAAEDLNENGVLDVGEDFNGDGILTPSNIASVPQGAGNTDSEVTLTPEGFAFFDLAFAQQYARWAVVRLSAIASVDGTETVESQLVLLPGLADDFSDEEIPPPGFTSPFGTGSVCSNTR